MPKILGHEFKPAELAIIAVGGAGVTWLAIRQRKNASGASSAVDPLTGMPVSQDSQVDPQTGETYLAEAQQYGSVAAAEQALAGSGGGGTGGSFGYTGGGTTALPVTATSYADDAQWAQAAQAGLTDIGYTSTDVAAALGRYLDRAPLTSTQVGIVQSALAEYGPPPAGAYTIIQAPPGGQGPTGSGQHAAGTPHTAPDPVIAGTNGTDLTVTWPPVGGADHYQVGLGNGHTATVTRTDATFSVATAGAAGTVHVRAGNAAGFGPWSAPKAYKFAAAPKPKPKTGGVVIGPIKQ